MNSCNDINNENVIAKDNYYAIPEEKHAKISNRLIQCLDIFVNIKR